MIPRSTSPPLLRLTVGLGLAAALLTAALRAESTPLEASPSSLPAAAISQRTPAPDQDDGPWWHLWTWM